MLCVVWYFENENVFNAHLFQQQDLTDCLGENSNPLGRPEHKSGGYIPFIALITGCWFVGAEDLTGALHVL